MSVLFESFTKINNSTWKSVSRRFGERSNILTGRSKVRFGGFRGFGVAVSSIRSKIAAKLCHSWLSANRVAVRERESVCMCV